MREDSAFAINHELRSRGLASLTEAGALIPQLAMFVRDHGHFRALLVACEPENRRDMYEALAPNVRFKARPLADYMIEAAQDAERRQLPTIGEDGHFKPFKVPEIAGAGGQGPGASDAAVATAALNEAVAKQHLHVVCAKCTREAVFGGVNKQDAVDALRKAGWRLCWTWIAAVGADERGRSRPASREQIEICPDCL